MSTRYVWKTTSSTTSSSYQNKFSATEPDKYGQSISTINSSELPQAGIGFIKFGTGYNYDSSTGKYSLVNQIEYINLPDTLTIDGSAVKIAPAYAHGSSSGYNKGPRYQFVLSSDERTLYYAAIDPYYISTGGYFDDSTDSAFWMTDKNGGLSLYRYDALDSSPIASGRLHQLNIYKFSSVSSGETATGGFITSSNRSAYSGESYTYYGSDEPDLLSIFYDTQNVKPLDEISIRITGPTLGSLLSLYPTVENTAHVTTVWQVNINGYGWSDIGDGLAEDPGVYIFGGTRTRGFTIPANVASIQYRVYAKDGLGWIGDYVTGPIIYFNGGSGSSGTAYNKVWVGVGSIAKQTTGVWVGVNGVAKKVTAMWVGVNGTAKKVF